VQLGKKDQFFCSFSISIREGSRGGGGRSFGAIGGKIILGGGGRPLKIGFYSQERKISSRWVSGEGVQKKKCRGI